MIRHEPITQRAACMLRGLATAILPAPYTENRDQSFWEERALLALQPILARSTPGAVISPELMLFEFFNDAVTGLLALRAKLTMK